MVQRVDALWQITVAAEVGCERVSLNRANVRDVPDNLLEFVLELDLTRNFSSARRTKRQ